MTDNPMTDNPDPDRRIARKHALDAALEHGLDPVDAMAISQLADTADEADQLARRFAKANSAKADGNDKVRNFARNVFAKAEADRNRPSRRGVLELPDPDRIVNPTEDTQKFVADLFGKPKP